jgi:hypothetical protein
VGAVETLVLKWRPPVDHESNSTSANPKAACDRESFQAPGDKSWEMAAAIFHRLLRDRLDFTFRLQSFFAAPRVETTAIVNHNAAKGLL